MINISNNIWVEYSKAYDIVLQNISYYQELVLKHSNALKDCKVILDNGAGTGNVSLALQDKVVYATDLSKDMLNIFLEKIKPGQNTYLSLQNSHKLPFHDNFFDGVTSMNVLYFEAIEPERFISESYRVLKKEGIFALSSLKPNPSLNVLIEKGMLELKDKIDNPLLNNAIKIVIDSNKKIFTHSVKNTYEHEEIADILKEIGFSQILEQGDVYCNQSFFIAARK